MTSASKKVSQPKMITGNGRKVTKMKAALRQGERDTSVVATRPTVPDDFNRVDRPYETWQPGQLRSFQSVHRFNVTEPKTVIGSGPQRSVGGKLDAILDSRKMNNDKVIGKNGWSK